MKIFHNILFLLIIFPLHAQISSIQVIQNAHNFLNAQWTASSDNITTGSFHAYNCSDATQKYVVTPDWVNDLSSSQKTSIPYKWGGFSSLQDFLNGITNHKLAGDIQTRHPGSNSHYYCGTSDAVGLDCSGFTSRCFELNTHYSTSMMDSNNQFGHYSSYNDIQPGDLANKPGSHVRMVVHINPNGTLNTIEEGAGNNFWRVFAATYSVSSLSQYGYNPQYYVHMTHDGETVPDNDICADATILLSHSACQPTQASLIGTTVSNLPLVACDNYTGTDSGKDVFFKFTAVSVTQNILVSPISNQLNPVVGVYEGNCSGLTEISCSDTGGPNADESLTYNNFVPGNTYFIRVYSSGNQTLSQADFNICITHGNIGNEFFVLNNIFVSDGITAGSGNADGIINAGEQISMGIKIYNAGSATAQNLSAVLSTNDADIQITQNTIMLPDIQSESEVLAGNFIWEVDNLAMPHPINFILTIQSNNGTQVINFTLDIEASSGPELRYVSSVIHDGVGGGIGNYNQTINPGEQIDLDVNLKNIGLSDAHNVSAILSCQDSDITITDDQVFWGNIQSGGIETGSDFDFTVSGNCPSKTILFHLLISSDEGAWDQDFTLQVEGSAAVNSYITEHIQIYPNPFKDKIFIKHNPEDKIQSVAIMDIGGKVILRKRNRYDFVNLSGLKKGIYFLQIRLNNRKIGYFKIIKQ